MGFRTFEWYSPGQQLIRDYTRGVNISSIGSLLVAPLFGGCMRRSHGVFASIRGRCGLGESGDPKVCETPTPA